MTVRGGRDTDDRPRQAACRTSNRTNVRRRTAARRRARVASQYPLPEGVLGDTDDPIDRSRRCRSWCSWPPRRRSRRPARSWSRTSNRSPGARAAYRSSRCVRGRWSWWSPSRSNRRRSLSSSSRRRRPSWSCRRGRPDRPSSSCRRDRRSWSCHRGRVSSSCHRDRPDRVSLSSWYRPDRRWSWLHPDRASSWLHPDRASSWSHPDRLSSSSRARSWSWSSRERRGRRGGEHRSRRGARGRGRSRRDGRTGVGRRVGHDRERAPGSPVPPSRVAPRWPTLPAASVGHASVIVHIPRFRVRGNGRADRSSCRRGWCPRHVATRRTER